MTQALWLHWRLMFQMLGCIGTLGHPDMIATMLWNYELMKLDIRNLFISEFYGFNVKPRCILSWSNIPDLQHLNKITFLAAAEVPQ